jgi:hypothetical protein
MSNKPNSVWFTPSMIAKKVVEQLKQHGSCMLNGDRQDANQPQIANQPNENHYLKQTPSQAERDKRRELHRLAMETLEISNSLRPEWLATLATLKDFCDGSAGYSELIAARNTISPSLAGVAIGMLHNCSNAAAGLACKAACNPNLDEAVEQTNNNHHFALKWAAKEKTSQS